MKVSRALETYWQRQQAFEVKLEKEAQRRSLHIKQDKKHELELVLYERHVQQLRLVQDKAKGKNVDSLT